MPVKRVVLYQWPNCEAETRVVVYLGRPAVRYSHPDMREAREPSEYEPDACQCGVAFDEGYIFDQVAEDL